MGELPALGRIKWKALADHWGSWAVWSFLTLCTGPLSAGELHATGRDLQGPGVVPSICGCFQHCEFGSVMCICKILCRARRVEHVEQQRCAKN